MKFGLNPIELEQIELVPKDDNDSLQGKFENSGTKTASWINCVSIGKLFRLSRSTVLTGLYKHCPCGLYIIRFAYTKKWDKDDRLETLTKIVANQDIWLNWGRNPYLRWTNIR